MKIELPFPPKELKPNGGTKHWAVKSKAAKSHKQQCYLIAKVNPPLIEDWEIPITITFHPKTKHKTDIDNLLASFKYGLDGIADAWGVDDCRFIPTLRRGEPVKGGLVIVEVSHD